MLDIVCYSNQNIESFKNEYLCSKDVSPQSLQTYIVGIRSFARYLQERNITKPSKADVRDFKESLKSKKSEYTINTYLSGLRSFFGFLEEIGKYDNITKNVKDVAISKIHKRDCLTMEQCRLVLSQAKDLREKLLFSLTLTCGLRANEVVNIRAKDFVVKEDRIVLYVLGKARDGMKIDYVNVPDKIMEMVKEYVKEYDVKDYLFTPKKGGVNEHITTRWLEKIINRMFERSGVKTDSIVLHSLRHTFATLSIKEGEDIRAVSQALRHKSIETTAVYLHDLEAKNNNCTNRVADLLGGLI